MKFNTESRLCGTKFGIVTLDLNSYTLQTRYHMIYKSLQLSTGILTFNSTGIQNSTENHCTFIILKDHCMIRWGKLFLISD